MTDPSPESTPSQPISRLALSLVLIGILLVAVGLRAWNFPREREYRDIDEGGYVQSSLALAEGMTPTFKASPGGLQIWLGWGYVMAKTAGYTVSPADEERDASLEIRPYTALNHALWDCYYHPDYIRRFELVFIGVFSSLAVLPAFGIGKKLAGLPGGTLVAGLVATLPVFVSLSGQTRPYSLAWSIGILSLWCAMRGAPTGKWIVSAILLGLAAATRIEMLCLVPFLLFEQFANCPLPGKLRRAGSTLGLITLVAVAAAPWFLVGLLGSLKTIVAVRLMAGGEARQPLLNILGDVLLRQTTLIPLALTIIAILSPLPPLMRQYRWMAMLSGLIFLTTLRPSGYGPQHDGPAYLLIVIFAAVGLAALSARFPRTTWSLVILALCLALSQSTWNIHQSRKTYCFADPDRWIQDHIPAGTKVFYAAGNTKPILPTPEAANENWMRVVAPDAWEKKFRWGSARLKVTTAEPPRALSVDMTAKDVGFMRGWFILGGRSHVQLPRYDLRIFGNSEVLNKFDLPGEFAKGGCVIASNGPVEGLGEPTVQWMHHGEVRAAIYCTPDIVKNIPNLPAVAKPADQR